MGVATENYTTSDDLDKVSAWYQQKLGPKYRRESDAGGTLHARGQHGAKADIVFTNDSGEGSRIVTLTKKFSGVEITLCVSGKRRFSSRGLQAGQRFSGSPLFQQGKERFSAPGKSLALARAL